MFSGSVRISVGVNGGGGCDSCAIGLGGGLLGSGRCTIGVTGASLGTGGFGLGRGGGRSSMGVGGPGGIDLNIGSFLMTGGLGRSTVFTDGGWISLAEGAGIDPLNCGELDVIDGGGGGERLTSNDRGTGPLSMVGASGPRNKSRRNNARLNTSVGFNVVGASSGAGIWW